MKNWKIPFADVDLDIREKRATNSILDKKWLTMGPAVRAFESAFRDYVGTTYALAVSSGTAALDLACKALGVTHGDEVIVPSFSFVADANVVMNNNAQPVFADIQSNHIPNISLDTIKKVVTKKTRSIIVVHYAGYPCRMDEIIKFARAKGISVIEDCAHAPGAGYLEKKCGSWSDIGCFSFFSNKNMTTGEGGMVVTDNKRLARRLELLRSHGITVDTWQRLSKAQYKYDVVQPGYNYRMDEIRASIGLIQLKKLDRNTTRRKKIIKHYIRRLSECRNSVELMFEQVDDKTYPSYHLFPILVKQKKDRARLIQRLTRSGIQASVHYLPIHTFSYYRKNGIGKRAPLLMTEWVGEREISLPLYPSMAEDQVDYVCNVIKRFFAGERCTQKKF